MVDDCWIDNNRASAQGKQGVACGGEAKLAAEEKEQATKLSLHIGRRDGHNVTCKGITNYGVELVVARASLARRLQWS